MAGETQGYIETGSENDASLRNVCSPNISDLLRRDSVLRLRDCPLKDAERLLWTDIAYDIDGIVITFDAFTDILIPFCHFKILPYGRRSLIPVYSILRKHFKLYEFDNKGLQYLKWSTCINMFETCGYHFNLCLMPEKGTIERTTLTMKQVQEKQFNFYEEFRRMISNVIIELSPEDLSRSTFKKSKVMDITSMYIMPDDLEIILYVLQTALGALMVPDQFEPTLICFQFGQRSSHSIRLNMIRRTNSLTSVHIAATLKSAVQNENLLWSRQGLQEIIGSRGQLLPALSLRDCANYQSNLDGCRMDIHPDLRNVCHRPGDLTFVQFYADVPHLASSSHHPVYKCIISCGLNHKATRDKLQRDAKEYIEMFEENVLKLNRVNARFELVCYTDNTKDVVRTDLYFSRQSFYKLLRDHSMLVPIKDFPRDVRYSFVSVLKDIGMHLVNQLKELLKEHAHKGGFLPSWQAYQYECASELFWKGKPNSNIDNTFAINLGCGGCLPSRCVTWEQGFLCLEDATVCALNYRSTPPLEGFVCNSLESRRIRRIWNFSDFLDCSDGQLGSRLLLLMLADLFEDPGRIEKCDRGYLGALKGRNCPPWARFSGTITLEKLGKIMCQKAIFHYPHTSNRAIEMIEDIGKDPSRLLKIGIMEQKLNFFPDANRVDRNKNCRVSWPCNNLLRILREDGDGSLLENDAVVMTLNVIKYLENTNLVHSSKFATFQRASEAFCFPWMLDVLKSVGEMKWSHGFLERICTFVTCVALLENHWYVNYESFARLFAELRSREYEFVQILQRKHVLSRFRLPCSLKFTVYKLHELLPVFLPEPTKLTEDVPNVEKNAVEDEIECDTHVVHDPEAEDLTTDIVFKSARTITAANFTGLWSGTEIEILDNILSMNLFSEAAAYSVYKSLCEKHCVPLRTMSAFSSKYYRLKRNKTKTIAG